MKNRTKATEMNKVKIADHPKNMPFTNITKVLMNLSCMFPTAEKVPPT